jgi:hypothetical protein
MKFVPQSVTRALGKAVLTTKKNQPHILFAGGVVGFIGTTVLASRATLQLEPTVDEIKVRMDKVQSAKSVMTQREYGQIVARAYLESAGDIVKLYGPSILLGGLSIAALTKSHTELSRRNAALTVAYTGLQQVFDEYRERVKEEIGEEREKDIYLGAKEVSLTEDGEKIKVRVTEGLPNQYARFFDKNCGNWKPAPDYNRYFLQQQQNFANQRLQAVGHVTLNDIYDWIGFDRVPDGQLIGWTVHNTEGEPYISFGLDDAFNIRHPSHVTDGWCCLLDFNVQGVIYDKI